MFSMPCNSPCGWTYGPLAQGMAGGYATPFQNMPRFPLALTSPTAKQMHVNVVNDLTTAPANVYAKAIALASN
jgi:hypothetical protein